MSKTVSVESINTFEDDSSSDKFSLSSLKAEYPEILDTLLTVYTLKNRDEYRKSKQTGAVEDKTGGIFGMGATSSSAAPVKPVVKTQNVIFAVDDYASTDSDGNKVNTAVDEITNDFDFDKIIPRSQKAKEIQKRRVKEKAEVFTPTWVCNLQNNLIDDEAVYASAFNEVSAENQKQWVPSSERVFKNTVDAVDYIHSNRLEITCGEGPYLVSRYDTVTGKHLDVRDGENRFQRIGLLDRKLRVVTETAADDIEVWNSLAYGAFCSTYGYEWQGDNLLLARVNLLNTYRDYHYDAWGKDPHKEDLHQIAIIISMNVWQMDGLRAVTPLSAGENMGKSSKEVLPDKNTGFYDGTVPVISFQHRTASYSVACEDADLETVINGSEHSPEWVPFEDLMSEFLKSKVEKKDKKKK